MKYYLNKFRKNRNGEEERKGTINGQEIFNTSYIKSSYSNFYESNNVFIYFFLSVLLWTRR